MSNQIRSQDFLCDAEWDSFLDQTDQPGNPFAEAQWGNGKEKSTATRKKH